jgi:hypothetical protein
MPANILGDGAAADWAGPEGTLMLARTLFLVALASSAAPAHSLDDFTLVDGDWTFAQSGLNGGRLGSSAGGYALGNSLAANPGQLWLWYRAGSDPREYALSNQVSASVAGSLATLEYLEPETVHGAGALKFALQYSLEDLGGGLARLTMAYAAFNLTPDALQVDVFAVHDANLLGTPGDDSATASGGFRELHSVTDASGDGWMDWRATERALLASEIGPAPGLRGRVSDGAASSFANFGDPFGPGDYEGGFQWSALIAPGEAVFVGATTTEVYAVPEPGLLLSLAAGLAAAHRRRHRPARGG